MKIQCQVHTDDYRGDHSADVILGVEPRPDETVAEFAERVLTTHKTWGFRNCAWISIRAVVPDETAEGE